MDHRQRGFLSHRLRQFLRHSPCVPPDGKILRSGGRRYWPLIRILKARSVPARDASRAEVFLGEMTRLVSARAILCCSGFFRPSGAYSSAQSSHRLRRELQSSAASQLLLLCCDYVSQGSQQAVDLVRGVVVDKANAEKAARFLDVEMFGEIQGVIVSVPCEEAAIT